jgi:hypothetical protein
LLLVRGTGDEDLFDRFAQRDKPFFDIATCLTRRRQIRLATLLLVSKTWLQVERFTLD